MTSDEIIRELYNYLKSIGYIVNLIGFDKGTICIKSLKSQNTRIFIRFLEYDPWHFSDDMYYNLSLKDPELLNKLVNICEQI